MMNKMSTEKESIERIRKLEEFDNFEEFEKVWKLYQDTVRQAFVIKDAHLIHGKDEESKDSSNSDKKKDNNNNNKKDVNDDCIYKDITFECIYGHQRHRFKEDAIRNTKYVINK